MITNASKLHQFLFLLLIIPLCLPDIGCSTARVVGPSRNNMGNGQCAASWTAYPEQPHPVWTEIDKNKVTITSKATLPTRYKVYTVNTDTLTSLMTSPLVDKQFAMVMPIGSDCETFLMSAVKPQSDAASGQSTPLHIHGYGVNNHNSDLRLLWNGKELRGQIVFNGATFPVVPVESNQGLVYLLYNKADLPGTIAPIPTENMQPAVQRPTYDR